MKRAVFEIKKNAVGRYYFVFKDAAGQTVVVSCSFGGRSALEKCLASVREAAAVAEVFTDGERVKPPLFKIQECKDGFDFLLVGFEGELVFSSKPYAEKSDCITAVQYLKSQALDAGTVDLT